MLTLGFSAGLPLLLVLGTLSCLREAGIDRSTIGYLSWVGLAYLVGVGAAGGPPADPAADPPDGAAAQLAAAVPGPGGGRAGRHGAGRPAPDPGADRVVALAVAFGSATQDIALDAFRIESADADHQAALAATYQTGYRLAMIWAGAGCSGLPPVPKWRPHWCRPWRRGPPRTSKAPGGRPTW